jgi:membrane-associated protease RseP (regulator of RpoE activity)
MSLQRSLKVVACLLSLGVVLQISPPSFAESSAAANDGIVGLRIDHTSSTFEVFDVVENSPSAKAGLLKGDEVFEVDGVKTASLKFDDVIKKIRGAVGATVKLTVMRAGKPMEFTLVRVREMPRERSYFGSNAVGGSYVNSAGRFIGSSAGSSSMGFSRPKVSELPPAITKPQGDLKPEAIHWEPDLRTALLAAKETKKRVFLYLTAKG